jgi:amino acid adenylation domain-containing protein/FkbM family methyltransferase
MKSHFEAASPLSSIRPSPTLHPSIDNVWKAFEFQVRSSPNAEAAGCGGARLTYSALWAGANEFGAGLKRMAPGPEPLIGVLSHRNLKLLTAMLGIFGYGGVYLPLDPKWPAARLRQILVHSGAQIVAVAPELRPSLSAVCDSIPEPDRPRLVPIETDGAGSATSSGLCGVSSVRGLAYVIYTSGSTGLPKGVMIEHEGMFNHILAKIATLELTGRDCVAQTASQCFDISVWQFLAPLASGGRVHIADDAMTSNPAVLLRLLTEERISVLEIVPSVLAFVLDELSGSKPDTYPRFLRRLIVTGEEVPAALCRKWLQLCPHIPIVNAYGPTECSDDVTQYSMSEYVSAEKERIPIGTPLLNTSVFVLDETLSPVPSGTPGELYVGGMGVGRGYLKDPAKTAQAFVPHFRGHGRLYRTGDLVQHARDGNLEFLGRIDRQDKIRGFRVEPEEIEAVLGRHASVRQAAVTVEKGSGGEKRLVAFVVPTQERSPRVNGRQRYRLPNNLYVVHMNRNETDFLYREMFEVKAYFKHGITIEDGDCVLDVGANIGLFSLFVSLARKRIEIYAFEPNPYVYDVLRANSSIYQLRTKLLQFGLSDDNKTSDFTFYPKFSFLSGVYADQNDDKKVVNSFIRRQQQRSFTARPEDSSDDLLVELLNAKFQSTTIPVQLRRLSDVMREEQIERVDLLKINVEKAELDVLLGIGPEDWQRIRQIALEVHDIEGRLDQVTKLLESNGYEIAVEKDWSLEETAESNYYVYARRLAVQNEGVSCSSEPPSVTVVPGGIIEEQEIRTYLEKQLPSYMIPSQIMILDDMPLTLSGKTDRPALSAALMQDTYDGRDSDEPRNSEERLLQAIWSEVLSTTRIGIHRNFFDAGGHSLLALQVVDRIRKKSGETIELSTFFDKPTIAQLASVLGAQTGKSTP